TGDGGLTTTVPVTYGSNTDAGTATADATYAGDSNHEGSSAAQVTFVIDKASSSTVISCPANVTFTGSAQTPCSASVTGVGGLSTTAAVVYGSNTNAGTATADATYAGDSNHDGSSAAQVTFTIDKASVAVIAPVVIIAYPTAVPQVGFATYPITGATDWTTAPLCAAYAPSGSVALTGMQSVGVYETRCTGGVSPNYVATSYLNGSLTITKAPTTTTINCTSPTYTGLALTPCTATVTGAGRTVATGVPTYSNNVDAGTNTASASFSFAGDANLQASSATVTFTIKKAPSTVTVTCSVTTAVYTGAAITPCGSSAMVTGVGGLATTVPVVYASNIDVTNENSSATATATYAGDNNHSPATASKKFSITKAPSTAVITCSGTTFPYTGAAITPCSVAISSAGLLATATPSYSGNTNAGTATASYTYPGDANRASAAATPVTFTITKVPSSAVITCTGTTFVYTGAAITPCSVAVTGIGLATTVAPTYLNNRNVGTATASYTYPGDTNHTASAAATPVTFTITKAPSAAIITCTGTTFTYTAAAITPCSVAVTGPGLASTVSPTYVNNINVGTATASYTYAGDANHTPSAPATPVTFAITQASSVVAVTCPTTAVTFTGAALTPCRATVTAPGVPSTVSPTYANNINPGTATASYSFAGTANVTPSSGSATFTIISATPTITYTGTQMANSSATSTLTLASATVPAGCTGTLTYALDRNPTTGVAGTFLLPASPVSTSGWRNGVYVVTTARAATAGCAAVSDSSSTITVASTTARAYGGGNYTVAGSPRVSLGWFIGPSTTSVSGEFQFIQNNRWKFTGTLNTYTRATSTGTATGTGTLSYWSASTSTWVSVGTAIPVRLVTTNGASGTVSTTFTYTPKAGEPALPSTVAQRIGTTIKVG
ncbi:MAG: hypothetical protein KGR47_07715, partial [Acidobacteria bacterium]|nr:hypothetical protein [Acidobacteriota bacterium]